MDRLTIRNSDGSVSQPMNLDWAAALERLAAYEETGLTPEEIRDFAEDVALQFGCYGQHNGRLAVGNGGLSTLEWAFDILDWDNPHYVPEYECEWDGCHEHATCGTPTENGYMRVCGYHMRVIRAREEAEAALKGGDG